MEIKFTASVRKALEVVMRLQHYGLYGNISQGNRVFLPRPKWGISSFPFFLIKATDIKETLQPNGRTSLYRMISFYCRCQQGERLVAQVGLVAERHEEAVRVWSDDLIWFVQDIEYFENLDENGNGENKKEVNFNIG